MGTITITAAVCEFAGDAGVCGQAAEYTVTWDADIWSADCVPMAVCRTHALVVERTFASDSGVEITPPMPHTIAGMLASDELRRAARGYASDGGFGPRPCDAFVVDYGCCPSGASYVCATTGTAYCEAHASAHGWVADRA